jgi:hypothetical protein
MTVCKDCGLATDSTVRDGYVCVIDRVVPAYYLCPDCYETAYRKVAR